MGFKEKINYLKNDNGGFSLVEVMAALIIIGILTAATAPFFIRATNKVERKEVPPPETVTVDPVIIPWGEILAFGVGTVALIVFIAGVTVGIKKVKQKRIANNVNIAGWEQLMSRYNDVITRWTSYEMDILKVIDYPLLTDMTAPTTIAFHQSMRHARMLTPKEKKPTEDYLSSEFAEAVTELEKSFDIAESTAKRSQWKQYDRDEQKKLSRAKDMLALALDDAGTSHERQIAYRGAMKILSGLIDVPVMTLAAIENKTKLELVA